MKIEKVIYLVVVLVSEDANPVARPAGARLLTGLSAGAGRAGASVGLARSKPGLCRMSALIRTLQSSTQIFVCLWVPHRQMHREVLPRPSVPSL